MIELNIGSFTDYIMDGNLCSSLSASYLDSLVSR